MADDSLRAGGMGGMAEGGCFLQGEADNEDLSLLLNSLLQSGSVDEHGTPVLKRSRSSLSAVCSPAVHATSAQLQETAAYLRAEVE